MKGKREYVVVSIFVTNCFDESYMESVVEKIRCRPEDLDSALEKMPVRRDMHISKFSGRESYWEICAEILVFQGNRLVKRIKPEIADHE